MTGVTPNGIRHPDGASKAKDLGFELAQMAGDMDRFIDESIDAASPVFREEAREAADEAVNAKVAQLAIVTSNDLPAVPGGPAMSIPFQKNGRRYRTAMEVDDHGRPTAFALERTAAAEEQHRLLGRTLGVETRTDVRLPGASAVFVYEGTRQIAGVVGLNGIQLGGSTATSDATDVARGDSTSASADIADPGRDGWFAVLMRMIDGSGINWGRSGARAEEITFMGGGLWITGTPTGNIIPASGAVEITGLSMDPWRAGITRPVPVMAVTATGLSVPGTLERIDNGNASTRIFVRKTDGAPIAAASIRFRGNPADKGLRLYVGMGINNEPLIESGSQTIRNIQSWYRAITKGHTGPLIIWGLLDRGLSEQAGTVRGDFIRAMETWLATEYGAAWCPVREYLADPDALAQAAAFANYVPTQADQDHVNAGVVPPGFRTGGGTSVHLNELGNWLQAWFIFNHLIERGLI